MTRGRRFLDGFARVQAFVDELLNLSNGWLLFLSIAAAYFVLYLSQLLGGMADGVAIFFTIAIVLGADLYFFVVIGRSRGHWLNYRTHWFPAVLWTALGVFLAIVNYESILAYQLVWVERMTEAQAFAHILWGISVQDFLNQRALLLVLLMVIAGITRHQRANEAGEQFERSITPPTPAPAGPVAPGPNGGNRRSGVPSKEQEDERTERKRVAYAYLQRVPKASARDLLGYLIMAGHPCSTSTCSHLIQMYRQEHPAKSKSQGVA